MLQYPQINPVALDLGVIKIQWYGLMYVIGIFGAWWFLRRRAQRPDWGWKAEKIDDLIFYAALGIILGGRIGYVLFYNFSAFLDNPLMLFKIWEGGMAFHGGLLGVLLAIWLFGRGIKEPFLRVGDFIAPAVPLGLGAGRIGNFINGELWGRTTDVPWGMVFSHVGPEPRHPSQLYQFALEGLAMLIILNLYALKPRPVGAISGLFLMLYGVFRFGVEFVRQPDDHIGAVAFNWLTMGQLLSLPMILFGVLLWWHAHRKTAVTA